MDLELTTKMSISRTPHDIFEAFVDPSKIGNFWFSSSSARWEPNKTITLTYDEYGAEVIFQIVKVEPDCLIVFHWGAPGTEREVTIDIRKNGAANSLLTIRESGWQEGAELQNELLTSKEGWVFMLTCLKGYLEYDITGLRTGLVL